jgi:hypothetical protein
MIAITPPRPMRTLLVLFALSLSALLHTASAVDTTPPTCKILDTVISGSSGGGTTYFTYYIKAEDETALAGYAIEYRARVNNESFGPWRPYNAYDPLYGGPLTIKVQCTSFGFQVRAVDDAGNRSSIVTRSYASPFPITLATAAPRFSAAQKVDGGGTTVRRVLAKFDFDDDGNIDVVEADHDSGVLKVRLNTEGDGKTFTDFDLPFFANSLNSVAGGKLMNKAGGTTNDDLPDLAVAANGSITVKANQGVTGGALSFTEPGPVLFVQGYYIEAVSVADLNDDGFDDIVATGSDFTNAGKIAVFLNQNGTSGGFAAPLVVDSVLKRLFDIQVADLNQDGKLDVAVTGYATNNAPGYEIFLSDGAGHLTSKESDALSAFPFSLALGDVTGDGVPDVVAAVTTLDFAPNPTQTRAIAKVQVLRNRGDGTFAFLNILPLIDKLVPHTNSLFRASVAVGDTNFDGRAEIVAGCEMSNVGKLYQLKTIVDPDDGSLFASLLTRSSSLVFGGPVRALAFGDLDGNSKRDIFTANTSEAKPASVLLNLTPGVTVPTNFKLTVTGDTNPLDGFISGWDFNFSTVLAASAAGLKLRVQSTLLPPGDPNREASWSDLPGGGYLTKSSVNNWKLLATDIPLGLRYFRVVASSDDFPDHISKEVGPFQIKPPFYLVDVRVAEVVDTTPKVLTTAFKRTYTVDVECGNTGLMAVKVTNTGSRDKFTVKVPRNAIPVSVGDHFRSLVATNVGFAPFVTPQATDSSVETPYLSHLGSYTFYFKARVAAATPVGELGGFDVTGTPSADGTTHDTSTAIIKAVNPKNTFFVTNTNDSGAGSLRLAVFNVVQSDHPAPVIKFEIPPTDPNYNNGTPTITLTSSLPPITVNNAVIDGTTQSEYARFSGLTEGIVIVEGDSFAAFFAQPRRTPAVNIGLDILSGGCRIEHLVLRDMEKGIRLSGKVAKGNVIRGCGFVGNQDAGVLIEAGASKNTVGGSEASDRNFFMAASAGVYTFGSHGVWIRGNDTDGNKVQGNLIGAGLQSLGGQVGMGDAGVCIMDGAQGNLVGGTSSELRNVIVKNGLAPNFRFDQFGGVSISGAHTDGNLVQGNYIGVDEAGTTGAGNELGIEIKDGAKNNLIGGTDIGAGNVISGSSGNGISLGGSTTHPTTGNRVVGNIIGLDALGDAAIPNGNNGIEIDNASDNIIGGTTAASRNIISGNVHDGLHIVAHRTVVQGNYIGTDISGQFARPNGKSGVYILGGDDNVIGFGATSKGANIIAFNTSNGVYIDTAKLSGSNDLTGYRNSIRGNSILGNGKIGIDLKVDPQTGGIEGNDGVNFNGTPKATDANEGLNHPSIQVAAVISARGVKTTNVVVSFDGVPNTKYAFDFYASDVQDPSGYGEGAQSLGYLERTTAPAGASAPAFPGRVTFTGTISGDYSGKVITCTATRKVGADFGSTSEFSGAVGVTQQLTLNDDGDVNKYIVFNAFNGDYEFHNGGSIAAQGKGTITRSGNIVTLTHNAADRRIKATADLSKETGTASYQPLPGTTVISITDTSSQ